jgi:hypothetical protein
VTSPAEELRAAATKLRDMAAKATPGPWTVVKNIQQGTGSHMQSTWFRGDRKRPVHPSQHDDYEWISLMGPDKAELLASWLDRAADSLTAHLPAWGSHPGGFDTPPRTLEDTAKIVDHHFRLELAFARSILGGAE